MTKNKNQNKYKKRNVINYLNTCASIKHKQQYHINKYQNSIILILY